MCPHDCLAEVVEFFDPAELLQGARGLVQIVTDRERIVRRIEGQLAKAFIGLLEIAGLDLFLERRAIRRKGFFLKERTETPRPTTMARASMIVSGFMNWGDLLGGWCGL